MYFFSGFTEKFYFAFHRHTFCHELPITIVHILRFGSTESQIKFFNSSFISVIFDNYCCNIMSQTSKQWCKNTMCDSKIRFRINAIDTSYN